MKKTHKFILLCTLSTWLSACSFFDTDNTPTPTPLKHFKAEASAHSLWSTRTGFGVGSDYMKLQPTVSADTVFVANKDGSIVAVNKTTGSKRWLAYTHAPISAGPTAHNDLIIIGSREGDVIAMNQVDGKIRWHASVSSEVLAAPAAYNDTIIVKSIDGKVTALSEQTGQPRWSYKEIEPTLILRGSSIPQITHDATVIGFANGSLAKITLRDGSLLWKETIAAPEGIFAVQRMVDIDANPMVFGNKVFVATYQGKIAALDLLTGRTLWTQDTSSYSGLTADGSHVYVSDANSDVTAYNADTGTNTWRQTQLQARNITGPVIMDDYLVVADESGYMHWISKQDGHFVARVDVGGMGGVLTTPVVDNHVLYVVTRDGHLAAYTLS